MGCIDARKGIFGNFQHYLDYVLADHTLPCHSDYTISNNPNFEGVEENQSLALVLHAFELHMHYD